VTAPRGDHALTRSLASAAGIEDASAIDRIFEPLDPVLTEWSYNDRDDPRGAFRFGSWVTRHDAVPVVLAALGQARCAELRARLPLDDMEGLGLAYRPGLPATFRWWLLAPTDGSALADAVVRANPERADELARLAACAGGPARCTAVGLELESGRLVRSTTYFAVYSPAAAIAVLELIGCPPSAGANRFLKGLCGLDPRSPRSWPKVWVGRSTGGEVGWKLYYFARGDHERRSDPVLLDLIDAPPVVAEGCRTVARAAGVRDAIQLLGLTFRDGALAEPRWTTYLAAR
jgi:hypothetical protein